MQSSINKGSGEVKKIVLGITGSIAAYKSAELARLLVKAGYQVRCIMTDSAQKFITPLTFESLTGNPVMTSFWASSASNSIEHIDLSDWADLIVIAPASADIIAKLAYGFAENPLLATVLATRAPVLVAPAMNVNMLEHVKTQENISQLKERGLHFVECAEGELACGWIGKGRLAEPTEIFRQVTRLVSIADYSGKRIVISAGPTREPLDPVRFISNRSSGKMGIALALEAFSRGAEVTFVHGPISSALLAELPTSIKQIAVNTSEEMKNAMLEIMCGQTAAPQDVVIMSAAVSDYRSDVVAENKMKKTGNATTLSLVQNTDILKLLGEKKSAQTILVGFAVETGDGEHLRQELERKLHAKNADLMVGNLAKDSFDQDSNKVILLRKDGAHEEIPRNNKRKIAGAILDAIIRI